MTSTNVLTYPALALEDNVEDVINKACKGLGITSEMLALRSGVPLADIHRLRSGDVTSEGSAQVAALAFTLGLQPSALVAIAQGRYAPQPIAVMEGLAMHTTPFGSDMTVNAYVVWDPATKQAISFDTGSDSAPMQATLRQHRLTLCHMCITHTHLDHLADIEALQAHCPTAHSHGPAIENPLGMNPLSHGDGLVVGGLQVRVLGTHGHTPGGLSYFVTGLAKPVVVVGDALFAGSMGGAALAYHTAIANNLNWIFSLPDETIVAPGHGPLTTVGQERLHNPFFTDIIS